MRSGVPDPRRLLLAHSYYLRYDEKQWRKMKPYPPLGTLIVGAAARERGFDVRLFDAMLATGVEEFESMLDDAQPWVVGLIEDNFNFLTKMCTLRMRRAAVDMVRAAKARGCLVAVNGSDASDHPELFMEAGADAVIVGEVEPTFLELLEAWRADRKASLDGIAGLALRAGRGRLPSDSGMLRDIVGPARGAGGAAVDASHRDEAPPISRGEGGAPTSHGREAEPTSHGNLVGERSQRGEAGPRSDRGDGAGATGGCDAARGPGSLVYRTAARPRLRHLEGLPFPAWDLVDVGRYREAWQAAHGRFSWNMVASRGCPYRCNWCAKPLFGRLYAQRRPEHVAEELRRLREEVGPDHVWFADDIWGLTPAWVAEFAHEVAQRDARTPFMIQSRANLMRSDTVAALADAGAEEVWMGVESGSQKILDAMDKGTRVEQVRQATRLLRAEGVRSCWFIQLGYLGEEWQDILLTRNLIREESPDDIGVSVSYPLPGTKFHAMVQAQLGEKQNWRDTDDLDMMFHGTYTTDFYKRIRDVLHDEVNALASGEWTDVFERRWTELDACEAEFRTAVAAG